MKKRMTLLAMLMMTTAIAGFGCRPPAGPAPLNIVVIILDTTRADHYGSYGYRRETTPFLDQLAQRGTRFTRAYSSSCWTLPSHASLFTGLYPISHGATQEHLYLEDSFSTLAERLAEHRYQTIGLSDNPLVGSATNLDQGFDEFFDVWLLARRQRITRWGDSYPHRVNYELRRWWDNRRDPHRPLFLFINYLDAHAPYRPPETEARLMLGEEELAVARRLPQRWTDYYLGRIVYDEQSLRLLGALYDAELRRLDGAVADVVALLEDEGQLENTLLVITSDHGENIGEHGHMNHVFSLYNTTLHIPLIMVHPRFFPAGTICDAPVVINDIFPTVLSVCGIAPDNGPAGACPLLPGQWERISRDRPILSEYAYPQQALDAFQPRDQELSILDRHRRSLRSVIQGEYKLIVGSDQVRELYQLADDPGELRNLIEAEPEVGRKLDKALDALLKSLPTAVELTDAPELDQETRDQLRALGYVD